MIVSELFVLIHYTNHYYKHNDQFGHQIHNRYGNAYEQLESCPLDKIIDNFFFEKKF